MSKPEANTEIVGEISNEQPADNSLRVLEVDFSKDPRWLDFISSHPDALIYHHPGWLAALESEYGRRCRALVCEGSDGRFEAILPLLDTSGFPFRVSRHSLGRRLSSLPRTPLAGPLAKSDGAMKAVLEAAIRLVRGDRHLQLEIKSTIPGLDTVVPALRCVRWRDTFVRGLPRNEIPKAEIRNQETRTERSCFPCDACRTFRFGAARDHHQVRWATTKAQREGISARLVENESELIKWYPLYLDVMRRNVVPPRPLRFFLRLWRELSPCGHIAFVLAETGDAAPGTHSPDAASETSTLTSASIPPRLVSGSILLEFSQTAFWAFTGSSEDGLKSHANDLVLWRCLHDSCRRGFNWFDLGEVAEAHPELTQFKAKWGTIRKPMYRYYYPESTAPTEKAEGHSDSTASARVASFLWQRLPLTIVAKLGDWIFRYL
jgi:hypothetical protein